HVTDAVCDQLAAMITTMDPAVGISRSELNRINTAFHNLIVATAENTFIAQFHERTQFYYWMLRIPVMFSDQQLL
ncbi:FCD domain-containing protein, partial [Serratia marcescens]|uniref:FCD domain-containing protein n=1 Tax=Serratia marcescens TaxID=615 RepID=UPI0013DAF87D